MLRLINFLLLALIVGGLVSWFTYKSLTKTPDDLPVTNNLSLTPIVTSSVMPSEGIESPSENDVSVGLQSIVSGLGIDLGIWNRPEEFTIESTPTTNETVLGYRFEADSNVEFVAEELRKVTNYFLKNDFEVIHKDDFYESDPLSYYEEYRQGIINCFMHAYAITGSLDFIEVGCNSEI